MKTYHGLTSEEITPMEQAHMDRVRALAGECMVLLENNGVLPLAAPCRVALFGNGARETIKGGTGSGDVNSRFTVTIEDGLEAAGFTVTTKPWLDAQSEAAHREREAFLTSLQEKSRETGLSPVHLSMLTPFVPKSIVPVTPELLRETNCDTAVYVLARNSGEGLDRFDAPGDYRLLPEETALLTALGETYAKVIVLLNTGGVIDAAAIRAIPGVNAVVFISQSGNVGGHAVADILLNKTAPSGRLTDTWALRYADYPSAGTFSHNNGDRSEEYYTEGIYVGYRYFDTFGITPLYPFGYGKSYTRFRVETLHTQVSGDRVSVTVRVANTGAYAGREVVQIYGSAPIGRVEKPWQVLAGFAKTRLLPPGESQEMTISFPLTNLESYDESRAAYILEAGEYAIRVGTHSRATQIAAVLTLDKTVITRQVKHICPLDVPMDTLSRTGVTPWTYPEEAAQWESAPRISLSAGTIVTQTVIYQGIPEPLTAESGAPAYTLEDVRAGRASLSQLVAQRTPEELADLCVGALRAVPQDTSSVIGAASQAVPGAAGATTERLAHLGIPSMVNADGPAGLRLQPHFRTDSQGRLLPGGEVFGNLVNPMPTKQPGDQDYYQFCTAIPIATLLASSWDLELIQAMGDLVGAEMEQFGIQTWLAPGMNIHRNPLCGRNFEYYAEDPLLSGLCAAADVRGVQSHRGTSACIKHFFANNQEDNRLFVNEHIGEQALRDIYLRNFAVAIAAAQPMCVMTSYNLVNGLHTANSYDAITCYAREEWKFAGIVMTDWYTSVAPFTKDMALPDCRYPSSSSPQCVYAGNDVQMPGDQSNVDDILTALADGSLPLGLLQQCALRLLEASLQAFSLPEAQPYRPAFPLVSFLEVT